MSCEKVQKLISPFLDQKLAWEIRDDVSKHLADCRECATRSEQFLHWRRMLQHLPVAPPPASLRASLRVMASHERSRRLSRLNVRAWLQAWVDQTSLWVDNLMRPLALPFAGGVLSALVLFSMLMPTLGFRRSLHNDVPTVLYTQATMELMAPFGMNEDETLVELTIDERGQISDYSFPEGKRDQLLESNIANLVLFSQFAPATWFGQPTSGKILVSFRRSRIVVRG